MPPTLPTLNASLNFIATVFLVLGYRAIKQGSPKEHKRWMTMAFCASTLFLISYIIYHMTHGATKYEGEGILRGLYFFILLTHTPLATLIVPCIIAALYYAFKGEYAKHVSLTRWLWPTWMYISITGVIIYLMLHIF